MEILKLKSKNILGFFWGVYNVNCITETFFSHAKISHRSFREIILPLPNLVWVGSQKFSYLNLTKWFFGPKLACWVGTRVSQDLLKNIQWFQTYKCWIEDLSRDHHLGSILACNSTTVPSRHESVKKRKMTYKWCKSFFIQCFGCSDGKHRRRIIKNKIKEHIQMIMLFLFFGLDWENSGNHYLHSLIHHCYYRRKRKHLKASEGFGVICTAGVWQ